MDNRPFESMEDFTSRCREDGFTTFIAFGGDGNAKRACVAEGDYDEAILAVSSVFLDRDDVYQLFARALKVASEVRGGAE